MADTGLPWELPYPLPTDLVRDGADAIKDLAEATADGLDAAGGLVEIKSAIFVGTQSNSTAAGANFAVTNLSITHAVAAAGNKLILTGTLGGVSTSQQTGSVGMAFMDGSTLLAIGTPTGSRAQVSAGGLISPTADGRIVNSLSFTFVYEPPDTASRIYTVRAVNVEGGTQTIHVNRSDDDANAASRPRTASSFVLQEVKV